MMMVHDIGKGVDIPLAVATGFLMLSHDRLGIHSEIDLSRICLRHLAGSIERDLDAPRWRTNDEVRVPREAALADHVILPKDQLTCGCGLSNGLAFVQQIVDEIPALGPAVSVTAGVIRDVSGVGPLAFMI